MSKHRWMWFVGIAWLAMVAGEVRGQPRRPQGQGGQMNFPELNAQGTIEGFQGGMMYVKGANERWAFQVPRDATVEIKGKVKPEFLTSGLWVQFVASVDTRSGKVEEKLAQLTLVTPTMRRPPGALPDQGFGGFGGQRGDKEKPGGKEKAGGKEGGAKKGGDEPAFSVPSFGGADGGAGAGGSKTGKGRKSKSTKGTAATKQSLDMVGRITRIKENSLAVMVPGQGQVTVELTEDPDIDVDMSTAAALSMAVPGATVTVRGHLRGSQAGLTFGVANNVQVALTTDLTLGEEGQGKKKAGKTAAHGKKAGDAEQPAAEEEPKETKKTTKKPGRARAKEEPADEPAEKPATKKKADE